MYALTQRSSSFPLVTFICGSMLLIALLTSTGILEPHRGRDAECHGADSRLSRALGGQEAAELACLTNYRSLRF